MALLFLVISLIDLYSKLLIIFIIINILTQAQILNEKSTILCKINSVLFLLFNKPLKYIARYIPHQVNNIDLTPAILLIMLWVIKYILMLTT